MRVVTVSVWLATTIASCTVDMAPPRGPVAGPPIAPPTLAISGDAFAQLEASSTIDGYAVAAMTPGASATIVVVFASWCTHCRDELAAIDRIRAQHPGLRAVGVNYRPHEEYDDLGDSSRVRAYVAEHAPWLVVVPADEPLFTALGRPPKVPTIYVYDRGGQLIEVYDRRTRAMPTAAELDAVLARISG